jgi:hypothetical protein
MNPWIAWGAGGVLAAALAAVLWRMKNDREDRALRGVLRSWPIRQIDLDDFDPVFRTGERGPDQRTEIRFIANFRVEGGISDLETWILCNLARSVERVFEFGTATGKTTYMLAANSPTTTRIATLTLAPGQIGLYRAAPGDRADARGSAAAESQFTGFYYTGTPEAAKIEQLFGDSKALDEGPYAGRCDLVFVDGSHARSYVESDSRKALRMARPGGVVLWHDYRGPRRARGVFQALNALAAELPLVHLKGTSLVAYRKPG